MSNTAQRSWAGGEIAPALYARTDMVKYATGARTIRNFICQRHGGVANRPGTEFVSATKGNGVARLIPFIFSPDPNQIYVLEFGDQYMRVYQDGAPVVLVAQPTWSGASNYAVSDLVYVGGVYYYCIEAHTNHTPPNATYWYPLTGNIYEIPTPYAAADLDALQTVQSGDVVTIVHPSYDPRELSRTDHTAWTLATFTAGPSLDAPTNLVVTGGTAGTGDTWWAVTALDETTGEESLAVQNQQAGVLRDPATSPFVLDWDAVASATSYNVYVSGDGVSYGYLTNVVNSTFTDDVDLDSDISVRPPSNRNPFSGADNRPSAVTYYQQRRVFAHSNNQPENVWASRTASYNNFNVSTPLRDDDAVTFGLAGRQVNAVRHLFDLGQLIVGTTGGAHSVEGDQAGILLPTAVNPRQLVYNGFSTLAPILITNAALYVQARGSVVRDLRPEEAPDQRNRDLTIFATHLFDGYGLVDSAYQETPNSIAWFVRDDGVLLGLTYLREHEVWGWHRHDTDGVIEHICVVPEGLEDRLYLVVRRTISGVTKRYIERMTSRSLTDQTDLVDVIYLDSALSYDGRNADESVTMTLTSGFGWDYDNPVNISILPAPSGFFTAGDVGNQVIFYDDEGAEVFRLTITTYLGPDAVQGTPSMTVPDAYQHVARWQWAFAKDVMAGLDHLEGKDVGIFADGNVVASPNNSDYTVRTVSGGQVSLGSPAAVVHVGLPYISDLETLDIDTAQGPSLKTSKQNIGAVTLLTERSRGGFAGRSLPTGDDPLDGLDEIKVRDATDEYLPIATKTGSFDVVIGSGWDNNGRIAVRHVDPVPLTVLAAIPQGYLPPTN